MLASSGLLMRSNTMKSPATAHKSRVALFEANLQEELATDQKLRELCGMSASPKGAICKLARFGGLSS
jgi:hypothetical protein